jgi:hypothetical protein
VIKAIAFVLSAIVIAVPIQAQSKDRTEIVHFVKGASSKAIKSSIKGYDAAYYTVNAQAGQELKISFKTSNKSSYFNVTAPGAEEAMFVGSESGNEFVATLPSSGDYKIQVYLMRNAARRNEFANYTLNIEAH